MVAGHRYATRAGSAASNITLERTAVSHPLAASAQRARSATWKMVQNGSCGILPSDPEAGIDARLRITGSRATFFLRSFCARGDTMIQPVLALIVTLTVGILAAPPAATAQSGAKIPKIGILQVGTGAGGGHLSAAF